MPEKKRADLTLGGSRWGREDLSALNASAGMKLLTLHARKGRSLDAALDASVDLEDDVLFSENKGARRPRR